MIVRPISARPRRLVFLLALGALTFILTTLRSWRTFPLGKVNLDQNKGRIDLLGDNSNTSTGDGTSSQGEFGDGFKPGTVKPFGEPYNKMIVASRIKSEDTSWITEIFHDLDTINATVYVADDSSALYHPPQNKGHEVMIYLTYIIDHYDTLSDVNIFIHSHRYAWHSNELLGNDAAQIISRLSADRVQREGYMNLRCHWDPGCPDWMHPSAPSQDVNKKEEIILANVWTELFPTSPIPHILAQPCCSQFAVSRDRIQSLPREKYVFYRDWLLETQLSDYLSGRVWEYLWQYIFTGRPTSCPKEHICYCDGFGICFGGEAEYDAWWEKMWEKRHLEDQLVHWHFTTDAIAAAREEGRAEDLERLEVERPVEGEDEALEGKIKVLEEWLRSKKESAIQRGLVPRNRATEAEREWKEGDGF